MILVLDNHDSFVHNLARCLRLAGMATQVVRSDRLDVAAIRRLAPAGIVLSPGPKRPETAGCCVEVVRQLGRTTPILGVCLGHQAIGYALGARIITVPPRHGSASDIEHDGQGLFTDCPQPLTVGRYHSLAVAADDLPAPLQITAWTAATATEPRRVMGLRHREWPVWGVQFHPESVLTPLGQRILHRFVRAVQPPQPTATTCPPSLSVMP